MKVNEIFNSIDGEGKRAGELVTFIRLTGCNLRCSYCDTCYSYAHGKEMSANEILKQVKYNNVTVTGGEPLLQDCNELFKVLKEHDVNIETNGSINIKPYFKYAHVWFTVDYKCATSKMESYMYQENFFALRPQDVLKFVVGDKKDILTAIKIVKKYKPCCKVYLSPVFDMIKPSEIVDAMKEYGLEGWKIQLQLHKFIWQPNERGV